MDDTPSPFDFTGDPETALEPPLSALVRLSPGERRERTRERIAVGLLVVISVLALLPYLFVFLPLPSEGLEPLLTLAGSNLTALVGVFGAVMGFYFGSAKS